MVVSVLRRSAPGAFEAMFTVVNIPPPIDGGDKPEQPVQGSMGETQVQLPWMEEPIPLDEAVEAVAQVSNEDADDTEMLADQVEELSNRMEELDDRVDTLSDGAQSAESAEEESGVTERVETLERCVETANDATGVECPDCEEGHDVLKSGVAAAVLVQRDALSEKNVQALNQESHLCMSCKKAFTPCEIGAEG